MRPDPMRELLADRLAHHDRELAEMRRGEDAAAARERRWFNGTPTLADQLREMATHVSGPQAHRRHRILESSAAALEQMAEALRGFLAAGEARDQAALVAAIRAARAALLAEVQS